MTLLTNLSSPGSPHPTSCWHVYTKPWCDLSPLQQRHSGDRVSPWRVCRNWRCTGQGKFVSNGRWGITAWSYCQDWEFLVNGRELCNCSYERVWDCVWRSWKMDWDKGKLRWPCGSVYTQTGTNAHSHTHTRTQYTHKGVDGMGCIGWGAPAAEAPGGVRRSGTLPTNCKGESRHVQQVPPATIFMKLLIAAFGFHQAWQWEPQLPISLNPNLQWCLPFRNPRSPTPPSPPPPCRHAVVSTKYLIYCVGVHWPKMFFAV